jgi:hypothetical protein
MKAIVFLLPLLAFCAGCSSVSVQKAPSVDLTKFHRVFVEQRLNENNHLNEMMVDELRRLGHEASTGPMTMMPEDTDAVLSYDARWTWDFRTYLIELNLGLRTAKTGKRLAEGRYYQPSVNPRAPDVVVHGIITKMFASAGSK